MTNEEMDMLTGGMKSKAEKVRALNTAGVSTSEIARYLDIRYQHVYNVLLRAGVIKKGSPAEAAPVVPDAGIIVAHAGKDGSIKLPPELMTCYGITAGEPVFLQALDEGLLVMSREVAMRHVTETARARMPEHASLIDALLNLRTAGQP